MLMAEFCVINSSFGCPIQDGREIIFSTRQTLVAMRYSDRTGAGTKSTASMDSMGVTRASSLGFARRHDHVFDDIDGAYPRGDSSLGLVYTCLNVCAILYFIV